MWQRATTSNLKDWSLPNKERTAAADQTGKAKTLNLSAFAKGASACPSCAMTTSIINLSKWLLLHSGADRLTSGEG